MSRTKEICRFALDHMIIVEAAATTVQEMTAAVFGGVNGKLRELAEIRGWHFGLENDVYGYVIPPRWRTDARDDRCYRYQLSFHPYPRPRYPLAAMLRGIPGHYSLISMPFKDEDMAHVLDVYDRKGSEIKKLGIGLMGNSLQIPFVLDREKVLHAFETETLDMNSDALRPVDQAINTLKLAHRPIRDIVEAVVRAHQTPL